MKILIPVCVLLCGCGSYPLAKSIKPPVGHTTEQVRTDVGGCKIQARDEANAPDKMARAFVLGLTVIGTPVVFAAERHDQRAVFKTCMESLGYSVREATN